METEFNVCKHKDEEECKKKGFLSPSMNVLFNVNVDFSIEPIWIS